MADSKSARIDEVRYDQNTLETSNSTTGISEAIYDGISNLDKVSDIAVDYLGHVYWTVSSGGKEKGVIMRAKADQANPSSVRAVSKILDAADNLCYEN